MIDQLDGLDIGGDLLPMLVEQGVKVMGQTPEFTWHDIGTLDDYLRVNKILNMEHCVCDSSVEFIAGPNCHFQQSIASTRGTVQIGSGCIIEQGVKFSDSVIMGHNCIVGSGSRISDSVIGSYCRIPERSVLSNVILTQDWLITFDDSGKTQKTIRLNSGDSHAFFQTHTHTQLFRRPA